MKKHTAEDTTATKSMEIIREILQSRRNFAGLSSLSDEINHSKDMVDTCVLAILWGFEFGEISMDEAVLTAICQSWWKLKKLIEHREEDYSEIFKEVVK